MSRNAIKIIACLLMAVNHYASFLVSIGPLRDFLVNAGYFTAPVMCYFLVEGYGYTRSKRNYALRLLVFAFLSQYQYSLLFGNILNMLFSLFFCFCLLYVNESGWAVWIKCLLSIALVAVSFVCDWSVLAPLMVFLFLSSGKDKRKLAVSYLTISLLMAIEQENLLSALPVLAAGIAVILLYNGKEGRRGLKWFFYLFYPLHLLPLVFLVYFPLAP